MTEPEYQDWLEEGDCCPICAERGIESRVERKQDPCTCFVMAPCSACVNGWLECATCGFEHHPDETLTKSIENYGGF